MLVEWLTTERPTAERPAVALSTVVVDVVTGVDELGVDVVAGVDELGVEVVPGYRIV